MRQPTVSEDIRESCRTHARLLDSFIALTLQELEHASEGFAADSLRETLDLLREERRFYGTAVPAVQLVSRAA